MARLRAEIAGLRAANEQLIAENARAWATRPVARDGRARELERENVQLRQEKAALEGRVRDLEQQSTRQGCAITALQRRADHAPEVIRDQQTVIQSLKAEALVPAEGPTDVQLARRLVALHRDPVSKRQAAFAEAAGLSKAEKAGILYILHRTGIELGADVPPTLSTTPRYVPAEADESPVGRNAYMECWRLLGDWGSARPVAHAPKTKAGRPHERWQIIPAGLPGVWAALDEGHVPAPSERRLAYLESRKEYEQNKRRKELEQRQQTVERVARERDQALKERDRALCCPCGTQLRPGDVRCGPCVNRGLFLGPNHLGTPYPSI